MRRKTVWLGGQEFHGTATHGGPSRFADYDGDGIPDVVSLSFGSGNPVRVHLFRGLGGGSLADALALFRRKFSR